MYHEIPKILHVFVDEVALNVGGSSIGNPGRAGYGGLIRGKKGAWLCGFAGHFGIFNNIHMELLSIFHGLELAWARGFKHAYVRCPRILLGHQSPVTLSHLLLKPPLSPLLTSKAPTALLLTSPPPPPPPSAAIASPSLSIANREALMPMLLSAQPVASRLTPSPSRVAKRRSCHRSARVGRFSVASQPVASFLPPLSFQQVRNNTWTLTKNSYLSGNEKSQFPIHKTEFHTQSQIHFSHLPPICATLKGPKGFGPTSKKKKKIKKVKKDYREDDKQEQEEEEEEGDQDVVIPEVVTNRMMSRILLSVGIPLGIGLLFFPFFYYLKVGLKIDVPTWVPFIVSFFFFGSALLGVSYGIVSSSWEPLREGSLLGWNEAQKNWPVFWQSLRGGGGSRKN
ncbi:hypothetical protein RIF29_38854 [Crotalaria pallida]|uniref:RNase H type-1 domain-containing protein n=1 Tax=Crotalaria pallida TaxID=3830 RepID=A0AAN9HPB1_CROPI